MSRKIKLLWVILVLGVILVLVLIIILIFYKGRKGEAHVVTYTEQGFSPNSIVIKRGDTINFTNNSTRDSWPASDLHPTHGIYPEFDPQHGIKSNEFWGFKFKKVGPWKYHDHLEPSHRGVVDVTE